jgi:hypothetical protein
MDSWEGVVATVALLVSLYSLWQVRRAPALARQRELWDQLRVLLDHSAIELKAMRDEIRGEGIAEERGLALDSEAEQIRELAKRLVKMRQEAAHVEMHLQTVVVKSMRVQSARSRNDTIKMLGPDSGLSAANVDVVLRDLDDACRDAASEVTNALKELNRLETR